jgi:hypothetical protein
MNQNKRIKLTDSVSDVLFKISDGNPGALTVLIEIVKQGATIDPHCGEPILQILHLDSLELYGSRIWMLYKDVCGQNLSKTLACIRGWQLGHIAKETLNYAIDNRGAGLDLDGLCKKVKEELPEFLLS